MNLDKSKSHITQCPLRELLNLLSDSFLVAPIGHDGRKNDIPSFVFTMIKAFAPASCATLAFLVNVQSPLHVRAACPLN